jgi:4,5-dihydroxyphthalate decarboxylase
LSKRLSISLACGAYDRTEALRSGEVRPRGIDLTYLSLPVEEVFYRMARNREFDAAEMSLSTYVMTLAQGRPFVAIPVFPSRAFRHSGIYVNAASPIEHPKDLAGKTVGVPEWQVTAAVWIRGILAEDYGVPVESVRYRTGGLHSPGREEKVPMTLPEGVDVAPIPAGRTLSEMLVTGELDAVYSPRTPEPFIARRPEVRRLFEDFRDVEEGYFRRTGIFPIMHVIVIRRELHEQHRWVARELHQAFARAKALCETGLDETASLRYLLPWLHQEVAHTKSVMGEDYWPYGLGDHDPTLATFLRYSHEQGLADRLWAPEEIFAPEATDDVRV